MMMVWLLASHKRIESPRCQQSWETSIQQFNGQGVRRIRLGQEYCVRRSNDLGLTVGLLRTSTFNISSSSQVYVGVVIVHSNIGGNWLSNAGLLRSVTYIHAPISGPECNKKEESATPTVCYCTQQYHDVKGRYCAAVFWNQNQNQKSAGGR